MPAEIIRHEHEHLYARDPKTPAGIAAAAAYLRLQEATDQAEHDALASLGLTSMDALAMRYLLQAERDGRAIGPRELVVMLGISTAAVTKLIDRLVAANHVERYPHPTDRRAILLRTSPATAEKMATSYGHIHTPLIDTLDSLTAAEQKAVTKFATTLTTHLSTP